MGLKCSQWPAYLLVQGGVVTTQAIDATQPTYSAAIYASTIANPFYVSYFMILNGNNTKTIRVLKVGLSGWETTAGQKSFGLYRLTNVSGGTPTAVAIEQHDSLDHAPTATVNQYATGNTPSGTTGTAIRIWTILVPALGSSSQATLEASFGEGPQKAITLRGTGQSLALAFIGNPGAGEVVNAYMDWTEE